MLLAADFRLTEAQAFVLASTDLFVEKAQVLLTRRSDWLFVAGGAAIALTLVILGGAITVVYRALSHPIDLQMFSEVASKTATQTTVTQTGNPFTF